jgi:hypothetical protein
MSMPPAGVDPALWARLPVDQRVALQLRGEAFMAMLAQQAAAGLYTPRPMIPAGSWATTTASASSAGGPASALGIEGESRRQSYFEPRR